MQDIVEAGVELDARKMLCGILYFYDTKFRWPESYDLYRINSYKIATNKQDVLQYMEDHGWLLRVPLSTGKNGRVNRSYEATDRGRAVVSPPRSESPIVWGQPEPLPDDEVESAICNYHLSFFDRYGRWPRGAERQKLFLRKENRHISKQRRAQAYENLVLDGTFVFVTFRNFKGDSTCYIMPKYSPEYAGKHNWLFYAPSIAA